MYEVHHLLSESKDRQLYLQILFVYLNQKQHQVTTLFFDMHQESKRQSYLKSKSGKFRDELQK